MTVLVLLSRESRLLLDSACCMYPSLQKRDSECQISDGMKHYPSRLILKYGTLFACVVTWFSKPWRIRAFSHIQIRSYWYDQQLPARKVFQWHLLDGSFGQHDEISQRDSDRADKETASMKSSVSSRRSTLKKVAKLIPAIAAADALFLLRADKSVAVTPRPDSSKVILITGCNSGIGLDATLRFAAQGHKVLVACRTKEKAEFAIRQVMEVEENDLLIPLECNLASLQSISTFVQNVASTLDGKKIDVVALNAGVARNVASKDVLRTAEGFELTVGTNHFGHFYLANLLLPLMNTNTGRIIVTASGVHDPDSPGGAQGSKATLGDLSGLRNQGRYCEMIDGGSFDADKAYKDSKLCNVLFTRELQRRLEQNGSGIKANCFNPGLIVGTGLFRDQNPVFTKVFDIAATNLLKVGETTRWGGGCLEYLCLDEEVGKRAGGQYYSSDPGSSKYGDAAYGKQFCVTQVSKEARDDEKAKELWRLSSELLGVTC